MAKIESKYMTDFFGEVLGARAIKREELAITDLAEDIYNGVFPTRASETKRANCFGVSITIPDANEGNHLENIEKRLLAIFERGRAFGQQEMLCQRMMSIENRIANTD